MTTSDPIVLSLVCSLMASYILPVECNRMPTDNWRYFEDHHNSPMVFRFYIFPVGMPFHSTLLCPHGSYIASMTYQLMYPVSMNTSTRLFQDSSYTYKISYNHAILNYNKDHNGSAIEREEDQVMLDALIHLKHVNSKSDQNSKTDKEQLTTNSTKKFNYLAKLLQRDTHSETHQNNTRVDAKRIQSQHNTINNQRATLHHAINKSRVDINTIHAIIDSWQLHNKKQHGNATDIGQHVLGDMIDDNQVAVNNHSMKEKGELKKVLESPYIYEMSDT